MTKHDSKDEDILAGAPEGATHYDEEYFRYWVMDRWSSSRFNYKDNGFIEEKISSEYMRSLADIKELVELRKKNAELENTVSVLMIADETGYVDDGGFVIGFNELTNEARNILAIRDLEQKADELKDLLDMTDAWSMMNTYAITVDDIHERMTDLRKQAKQLKGEE